MVVGAIPFDDGAPAYLFIPSSIRWSSPLTALGEIGAGPRATVRTPESPQAFEEAVASAVEWIRTGTISKIVLSRSLEATLAERPDRDHLLTRIADRNPDGFTFALDLPAPSAAPEGSREGRTLMGASPELLVAKRGGRVYANPL
ncbi:chorismate-binding protein, partial [Thiohalospira sp.]|uniref:chorismate-binding protein n=1 Tax=Thiohalospira sp. TaxID=3080549 RepID=UPI00397EE6B6